MLHTGLVRDNEMLRGIEIGEMILEPLDYIDPCCARMGSSLSSVTKSKGD